MDSCFDLVGSRQHGVASYEVFSWLTDIHILTKMVMTSDLKSETQIQLGNVACKTRDKGQLEKSRISCRCRDNVTADRHKLSIWISVGFQFGLYHVVAPVPYVISALHHCLLFCLFLPDEIFYRSCVHRQHFRLRSFASSCFNRIESVKQTRQTLRYETRNSLEPAVPTTHLISTYIYN